MELNEAPERLWRSPISGFVLQTEPLAKPWEWQEYIRKSAACVEVKEGFRLEFPTLLIDNDDILNIAGEALTLRTVEEVRREAISKIKKEIKDSCPNEFDEPKQKGYIKGLKTAIKLIDTPAPSRDLAPKDPHDGHMGNNVTAPHNDCLECKGTGLRDSGGVYPWGEGISVPCDCDAPSRDMDAERAEELRKAKEDAWDEGYQWAYDGMSQRNPYRHRTDEGGE